MNKLSFLTLILFSFCTITAMQPSKADQRSSDLEVAKAQLLGYKFCLTMSALLLTVPLLEALCDPTETTCHPENRTIGFTGAALGATPIIIDGIKHIFCDQGDTKKQSNQIKQNLQQRLQKQHPTKKQKKHYYQ
jgi:hypothetical protein